MREFARQLIVDQVVHGYKGGHRLLASSTSLSPDAEATLLTMSDLLTPESLVAGDSYLTGYPLRSAHKYVLARTWAAPESSRRGSVWTHSILLDYSTLAQLEDVFLLLQLFQRPSLESLPNYSRAVQLQPNRSSESLAFGSLLADNNRAQEVLASIYGYTARNKIRVQSTSSAADEALALGVWRQMWPSLRRGFAFSTRASADELTGVADFLLSFSRHEYGGAQLEVLTPKDSRGLAYLVRDLPKRGPTRLRRFLGRYAYDARNPRLIVPSLAAIFAERKDTLDALASYETLLSGAPGLVRLKQDLVLASAKDRSNPAALSRSLEMFARDPAGSSGALLKEAIRLAPVIYGSETIARVVSESPPGSIGSQVFPVLSEVLPLQVLAKETSASAKSSLLRFRPEVVQQPDYWREPEAVREDLIEQAIALGISTEKLLTGLRDDLTVAVAKKLIESDRSSILRIYEIARDGGSIEVIEFLLQTEGFLSALARSRLAVSIPLLEHFAKVVLAEGPELWCSASETLALISRSGVRPTYAHPHLAAIAFKAAAMSNDVAAHPLFEAVFDAVLDSTTRFTMSPACQRLLLTVPGRELPPWLPERLFDAAVGRYARGDKVDARVFCVSKNPSALTRLARHISRLFGEEELRRVYSDLGRVKGLQASSATIVKAIEAALPFFSKPLRK